MITRFKELLEHLGISASGCAEKTGVQRSSVSHILSGRNKPSVDFLAKIVQAFPDVNLEWLITGEGNWNKKLDGDTTPASGNEIKRQEEKDPDRSDRLPPAREIKIPARADAGPVESIIIVYRNNTFKMLDPSSGND